MGDDFKSQGSHVPYNVADFSTQVPVLYTSSNLFILPDITALIYG